MVTSPVAPAPTTAVIDKGDTTVNEAAGMPPKLMAVTDPRLTPVMVTVSPVTAMVGLIAAMPGAVVAFLKNV